MNAFVCPKVQNACQTSRKAMEVWWRLGVFMRQYGRGRLSERKVDAPSADPVVGLSF